MKPSVIWTIALNTFREAIRSKLLYSVFGFLVLTVLAASLFGSVTIGDQIQVVKNFGIFAISFSAALYITVAGAAMLYKEIHKRTVFSVLAKPVTRPEFLAGKFFGMLFSSLALLWLMSLGLISYCALLEQKFDPFLLTATYFVSLEALILCGVCSFFSSIVVTPLLIGMFTFGVFLAGRSSQYIETFAATSTGTLKQLLLMVHKLVPHLDALFIADQAVYKISLQSGQIAWSSGYAICYTTVLVLIGMLLFERRDFR